MSNTKIEKIAHRDGLPQDQRRRSLLNGFWMALGGVALIEFTWLIFSFLRPLKSTSRVNPSESHINAGPVEQFNPGTVTAFPQGRFYLACLEDGGFLAISRRCSHLGCTVPWDAEKKQFACPCHASVFDIRGNVIQSPAPRALDLFAVHIENNRVMVDSGRPIRRSSFSPTQVVYQLR